MPKPKKQVATVCEPAAHGPRPGRGMIDYPLEVPDHCRRYASMTSVELADEVRRLTTMLATAERDSKRQAEKNQVLGFECSRARRTTANAKWSRAAEERDLFQLMLDAANHAIALRINA
jgi:hypothetical protein